MHAMQGAYHTHHRAADMVGLLVVVGLAVLAAAAILVSTAVRPGGSPVDPPSNRPVAHTPFGGILTENLVAVENLPVTALRKVFDPSELQAITTARAQAATLAASRAGDSMLDRQLRAMKSNAWTAALTQSRADDRMLDRQLRTFKSNAPAVKPPGNTNYEGKPLPF